MKKTTLLTAILVAAIGLTCFTACSKTGRRSSEPDETRKPGETTEEVVDETIAGSENNDVAREVEKHNREVLAEALNIKKYNWQMDGILQKLDKIEAGKISDLEFDADKVTLNFKGEDGTEYIFYFTNKDNLSVMGCKNLTTGEMEFASYQ